MSAGLYLIQCGDSYYVGESNNVERREEAHRDYLLEQRHRNANLQKAFNLSSDNLKFSVIVSGEEYLDATYRRSIETVVIRYFKTVFGDNLCNIKGLE